MTFTQAEHAGVRAYRDGREMAPALNQAFLVAACESPQDTNQLLEAYIHGWTVAHLTATAPLPDMPSAAELGRILTEAGQPEKI